MQMNNPMQEASKKENPRKVSIPLVSRVLLLISLLGPQGIVRGILLISWMQPLVFVLMADGCWLSYIFTVWFWIGNRSGHFLCYKPTIGEVFFLSSSIPQPSSSSIRLLTLEFFCICFFIVSYWNSYSLYIYIYIYIYI